MPAPQKKSYDQPQEHIKKQRHYFADKGPYSQSYGFLIIIYGYKSWTLKLLSNEELMLWNCGTGEDS